MAKIIVNNPRQVINGGAKKYYFKVKGLGGPKGDKGDKGDTGATGPQGPQGNAATVSVGSTTTLPVGQNATVENVGTLYNAVLNFGIPQGPRGPQGATGATGAKGDKGDQGNPGPQGEKGTNATVYIGTTTTGEPGTQASVYNSGTSSNAVLNFTIPRGDVGPSVPLVQETGNSTTKAMSQNATTEALNGKQNTLTAGSNIQISGSTISATDTKYNAGNGITLTGTQFSANTSVLATKNDLGSYYTKTQIDSQMAAKQDDLVAGSNIQIENGTISATDTTYTAGNGLNLNDTEFSADTDVLATKEDLEDYYTKPEADNLLAPKLAPEVVAELPATGTEGKLYLTPKAHTTSTATGNPIEATITAQAGQMESFQLDGDTYQQSYEGKNLLDIQDNLRASDSGLNFSFSNNELTVSGTPTRGWANVTRNINVSLPAGQYTLSLSKQLTYRVYLHIVYTDSTSSDSFITNAGQTSTTITLAKDVSTIRLDFSMMNVGVRIDDSFSLQLEAGSTASDYEPFVGGQPSPSPDYPQQIQTVTGRQVVNVTGKNLYRSDSQTTTWDGASVITDGSEITFTGNSGGNSSMSYGRQEIPISIPSGTNLTVSAKTVSGKAWESGVIRVGVRLYYSDGTNSNLYIPDYYSSNFGTTKSTTITTSKDVIGMAPAGLSYSAKGITNPVTFVCQLEKGSTATAYTPYSSTDYPISLGSIELCKLGTYQDYIYKDGEDWKVHKATKKVELDEQSGWTKNQYGTNAYKVIAQDISTLQTTVCVASQLFTGVSYDGRTATTQNIVFADSQPGIQVSDRGISIRNTPWSDTTSLLAWVASNHIIVYYLLLTPTDTTITDQTLIAQLEAIRTASLQNGANTITNTATGSNLAGDMEIGYFGFNPTNRYDKFIWLDINNNYEQIGGE